MNLINGSEKPPRLLPSTGYADKEDQTTTRSLSDDSPFLLEKPALAVNRADNVLSASRKGVFHQVSAKDHISPINWKRIKGTKRVPIKSIKPRRIDSD
jgi:hypothetical protein